MFKALLYPQVASTQRKKSSRSARTQDGSREAAKQSGSTDPSEYKKRNNHWEAFEVSCSRSHFSLVSLCLKATWKHDFLMGTAPYPRGRFGNIWGWFLVSGIIGKCCVGKARDAWCFEIKETVPHNKKLLFTGHNLEMFCTSLLQ